MIENQSISKKERTDHHPGRDMLSDLPLSIIHIILALVPIRDAVKTSMLSRQWRYTWASLPHLVFRMDRAIEYYKSRDEFEDCMENFITRVLVLHKGPIHKCKLAFPFRRNRRIIGSWVLSLSRNDIKELIIYKYFDCYGTQELHSTIYSCKKLINLELCNCKLDPPPTTFKPFLFLRRLYFLMVILSTNDVESLVANCPLLEEFTSIKCGNSELRISAPNLKVLHSQGYYNKLSVYAPLLAELSVELEDYGFSFFDILHDSSVCNYSNFMGGFTNLEKLSGRIQFTRYLSMGLESRHPTLVFDHLKDILLSDVDFEDIKAASVVARLIVGAPKLEKLEIGVEYREFCGVVDDDKPSVDPHAFLRDLGCAPDFKLEKLRSVKVMDVARVADAKMAFFEFLLERSPVLETMSLGVLNPLKKECVIAELEGCNWASPNVELVFNKYRCFL